MSYSLVCSSKDRKIWLAARKTGIGASEMPVLLGASDWGSNLSIWESKRSDAAEEREDSELMEWGRELEEPILRVLQRRAGVEYAQLTGYLLRHDEHRWAVCTPDSMTRAGEPVEVKNLAYGYDEGAWSEQIPEKYRIQVHHQMLVTGANRALFGSLVWGAKLVWEWVPRDEALIRRIVRVGAEFWRCVESGEMPPSDGHRASRDVLRKRATEEQCVELMRSEIDDDLFEYQRASAQLTKMRAAAKLAEKARDAAADDIAKRMGSARSAVTADGWSFAWRKSERKGYTVEPKTLEQFIVKEPKNG